LGGETTAKICTLLFLAVFSWPFLGALDVPATIFGIPALPAGIFLSWAVLVYVLVAVSRRTRD